MAPNFWVLTPQCLEQSLIQRVSPLGIPGQEEALPVSRGAGGPSTPPLPSLYDVLFVISSPSIQSEFLVMSTESILNHPPNLNLPHPLTFPN